LVQPFSLAFEMLVGIRRLIESQFMRNDPRGLCTVGMDQVAQITIVRPSHWPGRFPMCSPFSKKAPKIESNLSLFSELVLSPRVFRNEYADNADGRR